MSKPWDKLRDKAPIRTGDWHTSNTAACVRVSTAGCLKSRLAELWVREQTLGATDLRELAEFCQELADQPRCPMEAAVDRAKTLKTPDWLYRDALRWSDGTGSFEFRMNINSVDQLDDLIAFLQEVRG